LLRFTACLMTETGTGQTEVMGRESWNLIVFAFTFTTPQMTLGLKPVPQIRPALLIDRSKMPLAMPEAPSMHRSPLLPSLEQGWYEYGRPCQLGRQSPSAPPFAGYIRLSTSSVLRAAGRSLGEWRAWHSLAFREDCQRLRSAEGAYLLRGKPISNW
jgi:hypothetical protein